LTVRDLAEYLHCHYATVYRLIRQREFRASSQTVAGSF
jgi:excisionase family DNA binding protein